MTFRPGDPVVIANPHPENAKWRGKTGTIREYDAGNRLYVLQDVERPIREKLLGNIACSADELKAA